MKFVKEKKGACQSRYYILKLIFNNEALLTKAPWHVAFKLNKEFFFEISSLENLDEPSEISKKRKRLEIKDPLSQVIRTTSFTFE